MEIGNKGLEIEVIRIDDLIFILDEQLPGGIDENKKMALSAVLEIKNSMIMYKDMQTILGCLGIKDYKAPKGTIIKKNLNYNILSFKSIRVLNRIIMYLGDNHIKFS